jgi:hypothetical protein
MIDDARNHERENSLLFYIQAGKLAEILWVPLLSFNRPVHSESEGKIQVSPW